MTGSRRACPTASFRRAILISEVGWKGLREFALFLDKRSIRSRIIIKGSVPHGALNIIGPRKNIKISAVPRLTFIPVLLLNICVAGLFLRNTIFVFTKSQTMTRFRAFLRFIGIRTCLLIENKDGYDIDTYDEKKMENLEHFLTT